MAKIEELDLRSNYVAEKLSAEDLLKLPEMTTENLVKFLILCKRIDWKKAKIFSLTTEKIRSLKIIKGDLSEIYIKEKDLTNSGIKKESLTDAGCALQKQEKGFLSIYAKKADKKKLFKILLKVVNRKKYLRKIYISTKDLLFFIEEKEIGTTFPKALLIMKKDDSERTTKKKKVSGNLGIKSDCHFYRCCIDLASSKEKLFFCNECPHRKKNYRSRIQDSNSALKSSMQNIDPANFGV